jgi:hypothetical protein
MHNPAYVFGINAQVALMNARSFSKVEPLLLQFGSVIASLVDIHGGRDYVTLVLEDWVTKREFDMKVELDSPIVSELREKLGMNVVA